MDSSDTQSLESLEVMLTQAIERHLREDQGLRSIRVLRRAIDSGSLVDETVATARVNLDRLRKAHPSDKDYLNAVQAQYLQFLEERRVLDQLGWTAFGLGLAVSSATAGLLITAQVPGLGGWPRILGMVFSIVLYWFGFWLLHLTRKTRRIHRVLGMAIEEVTGWFHLALTETANRPIRKEVNLYIKWFTWIYMVGLSVAVTWIILAEII